MALKNINANFRIIFWFAFFSSNLFKKSKSLWNPKSKANTCSWLMEQSSSGSSIGAEGETIGEIVFNTAMTGYQEILNGPFL